MPTISRLYFKELLYNIVFVSLCKFHKVSRDSKDFGGFVDRKGFSVYEVKIGVLTPLVQRVTSSFARDFPGESSV